MAIRGLHAASSQRRSEPVSLASFDVSCFCVGTCLASARPSCCDNGAVVFVADDLAAWLTGLLADRGRQKLSTLVLGTEQERALRAAATAAVRLTAEEVRAGDGEHAEDIALVISQVFSQPVPGAPLAEHDTVLEALQAGIAGQLAVLDDASITETGQSSADVLGVPGSVLAEKLTGHLLREIVVRGSRGGALFPLASQLNDDVTHLQGRQIDGVLRQFRSEVLEALADLRRIQPAAVSGSMVRAADDEIIPLARPVRAMVGLPLRNPRFVGREDLLAVMHADLGSATVLAVEALHGLAGVGKTQLAVEYVYRHLDDYDLIVWLAAEQATLIPGVLAGLAPILRLRPGASVPETASTVVDALPACGLRWLLVFDNAERPGDLVPFMPRFGGRVIITSRQAGWSSLGTAIDVDVMTPAEAVTLLTRRLSTSSSPPTSAIAYAIADQLGDLPLALEQAAAYLDRTATPAEQYLGLLKTRLQDMLARGTAAGHEATTLATLELSRQHLARTSPAAGHLLEMASYLGPVQIPLDLFSNHPGLLPAPLAAAAADPVAFADAVGQVIGFSLARRTNDGFTVHRLVAAAIRASLGHAQSETVLTTVLDLLYADTPDEVADPQSLLRWRQLLPHVLTAAVYVGMQDHRSQNTAALARRIVAYQQAELADGLIEIAHSGHAGGRRFISLVFGPGSSFISDSKLVPAFLKIARDLGSMASEIAEVGSGITLVALDGSPVLVCNVHVLDQGQPIHGGDVAYVAQVAAETGAHGALLWTNAQWSDDSASTAMAEAPIPIKIGPFGSYSEEHDLAQLTNAIRQLRTEIKS
jgi:hypothetical protein